MSESAALVSDQGQLALMTIPAPVPDACCVGIEVSYSAMSVGTESAIRVSTRPLSVLQAAAKKIRRVRELGLVRSLRTFQKVWSGVQPLGYSVMGQVTHVGAYVAHVEVGDWVLATGAGYAIHAGQVVVPGIYVVKVPHEDIRYAFGGLLTIGINSLNKARPYLADRVAIVGGGIIGWVTAECFRLAGCEVTLVEVDDRVRGLWSERYAVSESLSQTFHHVVLGAVSAELVAAAQYAVSRHGSIGVVGYGPVPLDRESLESKQFRLWCTNAYGELANHADYAMLVEEELLEGELPTSARHNLDRAKWVAEHAVLDRYVLCDPSRIADIQGVLDEKKALTVVLDWKSWRAHSR
jgi:threonine dehydrogenase-like Zn-dependent dehydrogenase